jgi:AcrR family transcriptional regulator
MLRPLHKKPPGRYHHGDLRAALISASADLVDERGSAALTLREVASRLGVSHAAPGHHFADKSALLAAVAARGFAELGQAMERSMAKAGESPIERLKATGVAYVRFAAAHPQRFRLMFGSELAHSDDPELVAANARSFEILVEAARATLEASGKNDPERLELTTTTAWSLVHGLATLYIDDRLRMFELQSASGLVDLAKRVTDLVARALDEI